MNTYLYDKSSIISDFNRHMNTPGKGCFHSGAKERFIQLFVLKHSNPDFFAMQNKVAVFWYNLIIEKYRDVTELINCGLSQSRVYTFFKKYAYNKKAIIKVYTEMLIYYNDFIVPLLNSINPTQFRNFTFKTLPDNTDNLPSK